MNYEADVIIDESALDVEWLGQAALAIKWSKHWAECVDELDRAEENVKLVRSEIIQKLSETSTKMPTGPLIEAHYRTHADHIEAKERWLDAKKAANEAEIVKKEIGVTRKLALVNLVELHGVHYFAGPSMPRDLSHETQRKEQQKKSDTGVAKKMKRRKK